MAHIMCPCRVRSLLCDSIALPLSFCLPVLRLPPQFCSRVLILSSPSLPLLYISPFAMSTLLLMHFYCLLSLRLPALWPNEPASRVLRDL